MEGFTYRLALRSEELGGLRLLIECLASLHETVDELSAFLAGTGQEDRVGELCPYFGMVWPSARALGHAMAAAGKPALEGKRVLEIGCGLAVPSLVAAKLGAHVTATDFHPAVPEFLNRNLALNGIEGLRYLPLSWREGRLPDESFDFVIGSDILYEPGQPKAVAQVIARHLAPGGTALIADPERPHFHDFVDEMRALGFGCETAVRTVYWTDRDDPAPHAKNVVMLTLRRTTGSVRVTDGESELFVFARFHAREGLEAEVAAALLEVAGPTRAEPGCLAIQYHRSIRDPRLFYVHSRWVDEAAFEVHAELPHTVRFLERVQPLIDHPLDVTRARPIG